MLSEENPEIVDDSSTEGYTDKKKTFETSYCIVHLTQYFSRDIRRKSTKPRKKDKMNVIAKVCRFYVFKALKYLNNYLVVGALPPRHFVAFSGQLLGAIRFFVQFTKFSKVVH